MESKEFRVKTGTNGDILCHNIPNYSLILFYSTDCSHCKNIIPIFKMLPGSIHGCQFGMLNVSTNKQVVMMSRSTVSPIDRVPLIILYIDGSPYKLYNGERTREGIHQFIKQIDENVNKMRKNESKTKKKFRVEYSSGDPHRKDDVCYLHFDEEFRVKK